MPHSGGDRPTEAIVNEWNLERVRTLLRPSTRHSGPMWTTIGPTCPVRLRTSNDPPTPRIPASEILPEAGPLVITYWAWAVGTPFVKIGKTDYVADRDGRWSGKGELARRRLG
jgi:hypothetical protein